jgi:hypothetical protein
VVASSLVVFSSKDGSVYALDAGGHQQWTSSVAAGVSSPAYANGAIFVAGGAFGGPGKVTALDLRGAQRWSFLPNGPVQSSPCVADGKVFFSTNVANGTVYALNATTGDEVWHFTPQPAEYILGSPVAADGLLLAPSDNGHLYALRDGGRPLLEVTLTAPASIAAGSSGEIHVSVRDVAGRATSAILELAVPPTITVGVATPPENSRASGLLRWDLGAIGFEQVRTISVAVAVPRGAQPETNATFSATLTYSDNDAEPQAPIIHTSALAVGAAPTAGYETAIVAAVAGALVVAAAVVWLSRGRRREPPAPP